MSAPAIGTRLRLTAKATFAGQLVTVEDIQTGPQGREIHCAFENRKLGIRALVISDERLPLLTEAA